MKGKMMMSEKEMMMKKMKMAKSGSKMPMGEMGMMKGCPGKRDRREMERMMERKGKK